MRGFFASSLLSLLLLSTLVWGGCISCEQYFMWPGAAGCCSPDGHCKSKTPTPRSADRECKQIAFDHQKSAGLHVELPIISVVKIDLPVRAGEALEPWRGEKPVDPSPPDLQVLNSTFLI